jgi:hypothetical protein
MMSTSFVYTRQSATIFDAPGDDPHRAISGALSEIDAAAGHYRGSQDILAAGALLDCIEGLRCFVLVRATLAKCLAERPEGGGSPIGQRLCQDLHAMIGDVPALVEACTRQGQYRMERDTRRAIACLFFLGSLDPRFI